jgi:transcriptional regulator with XRE-family HTH domain
MSSPSGYCVSVTQPDWSSRLTRVLAGEVRRYRTERKMSAQQLADRCADIGLPIARSVLANLESGRRETFSVAELLVLAKALEVAPILLLFPLGRQEAMEVVPGEKVPVPDAAMWFTGEMSWPGSTEAEALRWMEISFPADLFRLHARYLAERENALEIAQAQRQTSRGPWPQAQRAAYEQAAAAQEAIVTTIERQIGSVRKAMRDWDLLPPDLGDELSHIDTDADSGADAEEGVTALSRYAGLQRGRPAFLHVGIPRTGKPGQGKPKDDSR